ncbi:MAG TPA: ATPase [Bacteroidales bacterium]|nr:ATPase [Bacteroidales bacterium]
MNPETLEIKVALQILKPVHEVFEAIVDPHKMKNYFISESTGRMEKGKTVVWKFPEFDIKFPVQVVQIEEYNLISYTWEGPDKKDLLVEIKLDSIKNNSTLVSISEKSMRNDETGINWLKNNTEGWANFLACLKAYVEYGINLRKGGFDFLMKK